MKDCKECGQTIENCECHIPSKEKHKGLFDCCKMLLVDNEGNEVLADDSVSDQDREVFFDSVFSNTKPNENLVAAAKRYKSKHQREINGDIR